MANPIEKKHRSHMNALAQGIDEALNGKPRAGRDRKIGFILLVAEFGQITDGRVNYISNGERADMLAMMREYLARAEGRYSDQGGRA